MKSVSEITHEMEGLQQELASAYRNEYRFQAARYFKMLRGKLESEPDRTTKVTEAELEIIATTVKQALRDEALRIVCQTHSRWSGGFSVTNLAEQVRHEVAASVASQDYFGSFRCTLKEILGWVDLLDGILAAEAELAAKILAEAEAS